MGCIVAATKQEGSTYVLIVTSFQVADWVAYVCLLIFSLVPSHDHWPVVLLDCLDCENVHHTGKNDCFEVAVASVHTVEEDSHGHSADKAPGMVPCRVADIANHRNTRSAHTADRCNHSVWRGNHGRHWGLVEYTHHSLHVLGQHVHLLCLFVVLHIR